MGCGGLGGLGGGGGSKAGLVAASTSASPGYRLSTASWLSVAGTTDSKVGPSFW